MTKTKTKTRRSKPSTPKAGLKKDSVPKDENLSKILYKVLLKLLKLIPILGAVCYFFNTLFTYFEINTCVLGYLGGMSLLPRIILV